MEGKSFCQMERFFFYPVFANCVNCKKCWPKIVYNLEIFLKNLNGSSGDAECSFDNPAIFFARSPKIYRSKFENSYKPMIFLKKLFP